MLRIICAIFALFAVTAHGAEYTQGEHYTLYENPIKVKGPTVTEYFSYMCPHCYSFYPHMTALKQAKKSAVKVEEVPVKFGRTEWEMAAKAFVYLNVLKLGSSFETKVFERIHTAGKFFRTDKDVRDFFISEGIDETKYDKVVKSFSIQTRIKRLDKRVAEARIQSVPTVLVNGKYQVNLAKVNSGKQLIDLVDHLLTLP